MKGRVGRWRLLIVMLPVFVTGLIAGVLLDRNVVADIAPDVVIPSADAPYFRLMAEAWNTIQQVYVDRPAVQPRRMTYAAISGMVNSLGDTGHSVFLTPEMVRQERDFVQGQFAGIGVEVEMRRDLVVIVTPLDGSPAERAGLAPGDVIVKVDGRDIAGLPLKQVVAQILGPAGTRVTLTVRAPKTEALREFHLVRANIALRSVSWHMLPGTTIAHVRIAGFSRRTSRELGKALQAIGRRGATGLILDLRNDPGGLLSQAVSVASRFLNGGNVLLEKNARGQIQDVPVEKDVAKCDLPMVVLVNAGTASAAEIVAGALLDAHRAPLVGERTFGTATILNEFPLSDGSALMLAVQEWLTPNGKIIWHRGITPNYVVPVAIDAMVIPDEEGVMTPAQLRATGDKQLLRALQLLQPVKTVGAPKGISAPGAGHS